MEAYLKEVREAGELVVAFLCGIEAEQAKRDIHI
jgi:hypothetical protein